MTMEPSDTHGYWDWEWDTLIQGSAHISLLHTMHTGTMVRQPYYGLLGVTVIEMQFPTGAREGRVQGGHGWALPQHPLVLHNRTDWRQN